MLKFNEYFAESLPRGKGTGTLRRNQWDKFIKDQNWAGVPTGPWHECKHHCSTVESVTKRKSGTGEPYQVEQVHGEWSHKIPEGLECHLPKNHPCGNCLMIPDTGGKIDLSK